MSKDSVMDLTDQLRPRLTRQQTHGLTAEFQVLIALRFFAEGSYQQSVGQDCLHPVSQPTVSIVLNRVTEALCDLSPRYITFPSTREERSIVQEQYVYMIC